MSCNMSKAAVLGQIANPERERAVSRRRLVGLPVRKRYVESHPEVTNVESLIKKMKDRIMAERERENSYSRQ